VRKRIAMHVFDLRNAHSERRLFKVRVCRHVCQAHHDDGVEGGTFMPRMSVRELSIGPPTMGHERVRSRFGASHWSRGSRLKD